MAEFADGVTAPTEQKQEPQTEDYLANLVGDGKQYANNDEAAQALAKKAVNADQFIETLKSEKETLENQYNELQTRNRSIDEIVNALQAPTEQEPTQQQELPQVNIQEEVQRVLAENMQKANREQKIGKAWDGLSEAFGSMETAQKAVAGYINGDDGKKQLVDTLALTDPAALVTILKPQAEVTTFSEDSSGNANLPRGTSSNVMTWEEVQRVRKEDPKLYNSHAFKKRMHKELPQL